ncbi:integrase [Gossypium australe]|uniref:Integrase n=1 Tax=Gossypium australe TaxID=47621 RepID=A0A5B6VMA6_9ROSI|nr:integrase [Gossypium australe]
MGEGHDGLCLEFSTDPEEEGFGLDLRFTLRYLGSLQGALGSKLNFNGQSKWVIHVLEDILCSCVIEFGGSWDRYLPLMQFVYNNSYQLSIQMAPFEAL